MAYENKAAAMEIEGKSFRDSPPAEKGQKDSMMSEKRIGAMAKIGRAHV